MFKFFQYEARFPNHKNEIPKEVVAYISKQLGIEAGTFDNYNWAGRVIKYHRAQIREYFNFREPTLEDTNSISEWLSKNILYYDLDLEHLKSEAYKRFRELHIEPPKIDQIDRLTKSAIFNYENQFYEDTFQKLSKESIANMDLLINDLTSYNENEIDYSYDGASISLAI